MATKPSNANPGLTFPATDSQETPPRATDQREALQALLAFSTLHEQIRRRREEDAQRYSAGLGPADDSWQYHQFLLDEVLQLVAERAQAITGAEGIAIALAEGDAIICHASVGSMSPDRGVRIDPRNGFSGACLVHKRIIRCDDSESDPRVDVAACRRLGVRSMVAVPLLGQENVVGLLEAFSTEPFGFSDNHVRSLNLLAELILAALKPEDEERIVSAARAATADFDASEINKLRQVDFSATALAPASSKAAAGSEEPQDLPLEFAKGDLAPPLYESSGEDRSRVLPIVLLVAVVGVLLTGALWWRFHSNRAPAMSAEAVKTARVPKPVEKTSESPAISTAAAASTTSASQAAEPPTPPPITESLRRGSGPPEVTGLRHWMTDGVSTVAVDLQAEVQYETHRLDNPDRIYFDLRDTELASSLNAKTIEVHEGQLVKIRVAQPVAGTTRVVLETKSVANFSVRMDQNPYRLVIEVRSPEAKPAPAKENVEPAKPAVSEQKAPAAIPAPAPLQKKAVAPTAPAASPALRSEPTARASASALRIVIDAGHGGWDLGTVGRHGLLEKDLVLDVARRLGSSLQTKLGCDVVFTRKDDTYLSLEQRAELANQAQADLFVSVHANYSDLASARGVETYYSSFFSPPEARELEYGENPNAKPVTQARLSGMELKGKVDGSRKLAADIQHALFGTLSTANPGIRNRGVREASYVVLTGTEMPSILTEISFVSSPEDEARLQNPAYRQEIADALYAGIAQYVASKQRVRLASVSTRPGGR